MYTCRRFLQNAFCLSCVQEMCLTHQISCVQEMYLKCRLYCVQIFSFMPPNLATGNVPEMSCVLATGNVPEILDLPYTVPGNVKEISKFPRVGNVHTMNRKCELSCAFHGISWPRKFRISSGEIHGYLVIVWWNDMLHYIVGVRPICQHNFGNNRMLKELRIMLE